MGNHLKESTSVEKAKSLVSGFCYARNRDILGGQLAQNHSMHFICLNNSAVEKVLGYFAFQGGGG